MFKKLKVIIPLIILVVCFISISSKYKIEIIGDSMIPTYKNGDVLYFNKYTKYITLNKNDVVIFKNSSYNDFIIKRIVGLENDIIEIKNNILYINNIKYITYDINKNNILISYKKFIVGKGEVFVLGDNFYNSLDSKFIGCILIKDIKGYIKEKR